MQDWVITSNISSVISVDQGYIPNHQEPLPKCTEQYIRLVFFYCALVLKTLSLYPICLLSLHSTLDISYDSMKLTSVIHALRLSVSNLLRRPARVSRVCWFPSCRAPLPTWRPWGSSSSCQSTRPCRIPKTTSASPSPWRWRSSGSTPTPAKCWVLCWYLSARLIPDCTSHHGRSYLCPRLRPS